MEWTTHMLSGMVGGYVITGGDWKGALVGGIAGIIPDIDEHRSKFGKMLFPISYPINKVFGHRTLTHSLLFALLVLLTLLLFFDSWVWKAAVVGILTHILGDMLTGKVKFFYPAKKSIGVAVNRMTFKIIDKAVAVLLLLYVGRELLIIAL